MSSLRPVLGWLFLALCVAGCSGGAGAGADAGAPDAASIALPAPPAPPALPDWPCPPGWREVADGDVTTCDPYPEGGALDCAVDEAHFPGEPVCSRIGTLCPAGEWPEGLPVGRPVIYVRAGGAPGGDGTQALPFGTITSALAAAPPAAIIALGKGTFDEVVVLGAGLALWGACVAETRVASSVPSDTEGTLTVFGAGAEVHNLQVGGARYGLFVGAGATLLVEDVLVADAADAGWMVYGSATGRNVVIRDTEARASDGEFGYGMDVGNGGQVDITRVAFERNRVIGVFAGADTAVTLSDMVIRDTQARASDGNFGYALDVENGGRVDVVRATLERNRIVGVYAGVGTSVTLTDVVVRDTLGRVSDGWFGQGLSLSLGAHVEVARAVFERNRHIAVYASDSGTNLGLTDVVVRDTQGEDDGAMGRGLHAQAGARVDAARAVFARNRQVGVFASGAGTTVVLSDAAVRDTLGQDSDRQWGRGLHAELGARVEVVRAVFEHNREIGVAVFEADTTLILADVVVRDTQSQESDGWYGGGLSAQTGARVEGARVAFERNRDIGVAASDSGTTLVLSDVAVRDTGSRASDGAYGRGLDVEAGARVEGVRAVFERNRDVGVYASGAGTTVVLSDVAVRDMQDQECEATGGCRWRVAAHVGSYRASDVSITRFALSGSVFLGVQLALGGTVDLHAGEVSGNPIAVNVQTEGFDLARLQDQVTFRDNGINFDGSALDIPDPAPPAGP